MPAPQKRKKRVAGKKNFLSRFKDLRIFLILFLFLLVTILYFIFLKSNVIISSEKYYIFIPAHATNDEVGEILKKEEIISNKLSFVFAADILNLLPPKRGGLYKIEKNWNNVSLIQKIKNSSPLNYSLLEVQSYRSRKKMLSNVCRQLGLKSENLLRAFKEADSLKTLNAFDEESMYCLFIPGRYKVPTGITEKELVSILHGEFLHFWNKNRRKQLEEIDLTPIEAVILSSIVYSETKVYQEMPLIAGVYLNRLKKDMRLEADPTLVFASGNFRTRRVYINNKKLAYPEYNTYKKKGLPPGPIHFPPVEAIDAVLNSENHNYIYFCAKGDTTGCHLFAETFEEHKLNAKKFRENLNAKKIYN